MIHTQEFAQKKRWRLNPDGGVSNPGGASNPGGGGTSNLGAGVSNQAPVGIAPIEPEQVHG